MTGNVYTSNTGMCSCNHCRHGTAITITYSKYVSVALVIQQPQHMRHIMYRVIQNNCLGFNNLSYTIHLRQDYM